jgi:hypothetical protein
VYSSVVSSQVDLARFGGVVPEVASRARRAHHPGDRRGAGRIGCRDLGVGAAGVPRPRARGRCSSEERGQGDRAQRTCRTSGVNHLEAHLYAARLEEPDSNRRSRCCWCRRAHDGRDHGRPRAVPRRRETVDDARPARPSTRCAAPRPRVSGWPRRSARSRSRAIPRRAVPAGDAGRPQLLVRRAEDCGREPRASSPSTQLADVAASFREAVVDQARLKLPRRRRCRGADLVLGEAWRPTRLRRGRGRRGHRAAGVPPPPRRCAPTTGRRSRGGLVEAPGRRPHAARLRRRPQPAFAGAVIPLVP